MVRFFPWMNLLTISARHQKVVLPPVAPEGYHMCQHSKLKTLHLMAHQNQKTFACGRGVGRDHRKDGFIARCDTPFCSLCFTRENDDR